MFSRLVAERVHSVIVCFICPLLPAPTGRTWNLLCCFQILWRAKSSKTFLALVKGQTKTLHRQKHAILSWSLFFMFSYFANSPCPCPFCLLPSNVVCHIVKQQVLGFSKTKTTYPFHTKFTYIRITLRRSDWKFSCC